jgi:hypothetical protein
MTKVDNCPSAEAPGEVSGFDIRHSFVIGYFVIRHYMVASTIDAAL